MKNNLKGLVLILLLIFTFSCSKSDDGDISGTSEPTPTPQPEPEFVTDVYAVGYEWTNNNFKAIIWKNGVATYLTEGMDGSRAVDVFVSGTDVYVLGAASRSGGDFQTTLWKNGEKIVLPHKNWARAKALFVHNGHTVVVGHEEDDIKPNSMYGTPILWRNDLKTTLDYQGVYTLNDVFVVNDDLYVVGTEYVRSGLGTNAVLWKNGVRMALTDQKQNSYAWSVSVSGNDVYITGQVNGRSTLWINGVARWLSLDDGKKLFGKIELYVSGNDVYTAGIATSLIEPFGYGRVSKNDEAPIILSPMADRSDVRSIFVSGTDVYVGGSMRNTSTSMDIATYWKNGQEVKLTDGSTNALVNAIFVVRQLKNRS